MISGLLHSEGSTWTQQRRFVLKNLRDFGFGKKTMEAMAHEDIVELINKIKESLGKPMSPNPTLSLAVLNSLWHIITGERFSLDDPRFQHVFDSLKALVQNS